MVLRAEKPQWVLACWELTGTYNIQFAGGVQGVGFVLPERRAAGQGVILPGGRWTVGHGAPGVLCTALVGGRRVRGRWAVGCRPERQGGLGGGGGGWHKASVFGCLPLAAPIGLSPLLILTLCGSERVLVVSKGGGGGQGV